METAKPVYRRVLLKISGEGFSKAGVSGIDPEEVVLQAIVELSVGIDSCIARAEKWLATQ